MAECMNCGYCKFPRTADDNGGACKCKIMKHKTIDVYVSGVIVPPCKVGDTVYRVITMGTGVTRKYVQQKAPNRLGYCGETIPCDETIKKFIRSVNVTRNNYLEVIENFGKTVFLSREEAERALHPENDIDLLTNLNDRM